MRSILVASIATCALLTHLGCCSAQGARSAAEAPQSLTGPGGVDSRVHGTGAKTAPNGDETADEATEKADAAKRRELTKDDPPAATPRSPPSDSPASGDASGTAGPKSGGAPKQAEGAETGQAAKQASDTSDKKDGEAAPSKLEKGRVGALSPDEQRRAARARERAEAARKLPTMRDKPVRDADKPNQTTTVSVGKAAVDGKKPDSFAEPDRPTTAGQEVGQSARERAEAPRQMDRRQTVTPTETRRKKVRAYSAAPSRGPRVGDVIPEGVPLYPLPPGYDRSPRRALAGGGRGPRVGDVLPPGMPTYPVPPGYGPDD